ncbi:MAG: hypothetical protein J6J52_05450 [Oscillospiraceae bacterium]|nr:hypothetical protein [Oscillospiraceae bacterium]
MKDYAKKAAFPIILSTLLVSMIMNIYNNSEIIPITVLALIVITALFFLFKLLTKRKILGGLVYTAILFGTFFFLMSFMFSNWYAAPMPFSSWFYAAQDETTKFAPFSIVLFVAFSFFLSSVLFYYTQIIYRSAAVLLCSLIPFAIYAKRYETPETIYIAAVLIVFLALMVHQRQLSHKEHIVLTDGSYWISVSLFVGVVIGLAIIIPKPQVTPLRDTFDEMIEAMEGVSVDADQVIGKLQTETDGSEFNEAPTGKMYYYVLSDNAPLYLKSQTYDEYIGKRRWKVTKEYYETGYSDWGSKQSYLTYSNIVEAVRTYQEANGITDRYDTPEVENNVGTSAEIYASDFPAQYALTANGIYTVRETDYSERVTYRNSHGDVFWEVSYMPPTDKYKIYYSSENADMMDGAAEFAMQFDRKSFRELLVEIEDFNDEEGTSDFTAMYFRQELDDAEKYLDSTERGISDEIQALADEITEGCYSDFEKANAIRNYFLSGDYSYQLGFRASGSDIETFIFEDKTGICVDYATATVLLARAAGLPARYTTGFLMTEPMSDGYYAVRDKHGHAWAEIYISGYGWMTFDSTPASDEIDDGMGGTEQNIDPMETMWVVFVLSAIGVLLAILIIVFLPTIREVIFRIIFSLSKGEKKIVRLYKRTSKLLGKKSGENTEAYSTVELAVLAKEKFGYDISPVTKLTEKVCYGKIPAEKNETEKSFECYKGLLKVIKKKK